MAISSTRAERRAYARLNPLVLRATGRHLLRHPWQLGLALLGIALGIAVVCAVQLTQASARQSLAYAQRSLSGPTTHRIESAAAADSGLDERDYLAFAARWPRVSAMPLLSGRVRVSGATEYDLTVAGIDVLAARADDAASRRLGATLDLGAFVGRAGTAVVNIDTARRLGLVPGAKLRIVGGGREQAIEIVAVAPAARDGGPADDMLVMDLANAQEALDAVGRLSAIELVLPARDRAQRVRALRASLPAGWQLIANDRRFGAAREMTRAFDVNLTALSLLALLVGMFLIYNTVSFLTLQRRSLFGRLRALGVEARELFAALLLESCLLGLVGIALGMLLGRVVAGVLLQFVARTVNDLYYRAAITEVTTPPSLLVSIVLLGLVATLAAALPPIRAVTRETTRAAERAPAARHAGFPLVPTALALIVGAGLLAWPTRALWPGFGALFAFLVCAALPVPWLLARAAQACSRLPRLSSVALIALRTLAAHGQRAGLAAAALMVACATGLAVTVMVASFRVSVTDWLQALLRADVYVNLGDSRTAEGTLPLAAIRARLAGLPEVATTSAVVRTTTRLDGDAAAVQLFAYDLPAAARAGFQFISGDAAAWWKVWDDEDVVMVTEAFAWRQRVQVGDELPLVTPAGVRRFRVLGIYRDYASERGSVALSRRVLQRHFALPDDSGIGVYAAAGVPPAALERALRRALADRPEARLQSNAALRALSLEIFDQTFAVTDLLRVLALGVAVVGIVSALLAQQLERLGDYALMRALGFARSELLRVVLWQTLVTGAVAATLALPVGLALAVLLIDVINVRSFGWTMSLHLPWSALGSVWLSALAAALVAGLHPAHAVSRRTPASVLRND